jgi:hypothetical protein
MTTADAPVRRRAPRATHFSPVAAGRLLRLELRHSAVPWMIPLLIALFLFDPYRTSMGYPAIWDLRESVILNKLLPDFVAFVAGFSAWMGSRDGRRRTADLMAATARPAWARQGGTLVATICWVLATYLALVAVLFVAIARQATWGSPSWWPVAVGAVALVALCTAGFAAGTFFPGRFTAPLAAIAAFVLSLEGFKIAVGRSSSYALLSPSTFVPNLDIGVFYPYLPDVAIAQVMFLAGFTAVALGVLGLSPAAADGGPRLRRTAAILAVAGLVAAGTAVGLAGTARQEVHGAVIPALHDAASDRPIPFTPVCSHSAVQVCVHPAFRAVLHDTTTALDQVLGEVAGLPGAPVRATEIATNNLSPGNGTTISGTPPVFRFAMIITPGSFGVSRGNFVSTMQADFLTAFIGGPAAVRDSVTAPTQRAADPAQQVVEGVLLNAVTPGTWHPSSVTGPGHARPAAVAAASKRFAALSPAARHAWLAANLPALRAGHISLAQLP